MLPPCRGFFDADSIVGVALRLHRLAAGKAPAMRPVSATQFATYSRLATGDWASAKQSRVDMGRVAVVPAAQRVPFEQTVLSDVNNTRYIAWLFKGRRYKATAAPIYFVGEFGSGFRACLRRR